MVVVLFTMRWEAGWQKLGGSRAGRRRDVAALVDGTKRQGIRSRRHHQNVVLLSLFRAPSVKPCMIDMSINASVFLSDVFVADKSVKSRRLSATIYTQTVAMRA